MRAAYIDLHHAGAAHSLECWHRDELVGGLYGVAIGRVFFGESMFSRHSNASKVAFVRLSQWLLAWDFGLIDCQIHNPHLATMGAHTIDRDVFTTRIDSLCLQAPSTRAWSVD